MGSISFSSAFGQVIRRHRQRCGLSQEALAAEANIHRTHVGLLERGERGIGLDVAHRLATAVGQPLSAIVTEVEKELASKRPSTAGRKSS